MIVYQDLPGPRGLPLIGSLHRVRFPRLHAWFEQQASVYGKVYRVRLGPARLTVISDPSMIQQILKARPDRFRRGAKLDQVIRGEGIHGLFNAEGEEWKVHRRIVTRGLDIKHQRRFFPVMTNILARLKGNLDRQAASAIPFFIHDDLLRFTVDVTTSLAFGIDMNTLEQKSGAIQDHMEKIFPMIFRRINDPFPWYKYFPFRRDREYDHALREIGKQVDRFIQAGRERMARDPGLREQPGNILDALLGAAGEEPSIGDREIKGNLMTLLMAGEDTTAHSLAWAICLLGGHPEVFRRLQEEADTVLCPDTYLASYEQLGSLRYTDAVIQETLRLKAVAPVMLVEPIHDEAIDGYQLRKGSRIVLLTRASANREEYFSRPGDMCPERWLDAAAAGCPAHTPEAMLSFGAGPRLCPGKNLATLEMKLVLSMIARLYDLELLANPEDISENMAFTMMPDPFRIRLRTRA